MTELTKQLRAIYAVVQAFMHEVEMHELRNVSTVNTGRASNCSKKNGEDARIASSV
jgi:hypothetical protein